MKRFTKIHVATDGATSLDWTTQDEGEMYTHKLVCKDPPHANFVTALNALIGDVLQIVELPIGYAADMRVTGVSFSLTEKTGSRGATVSIVKPVMIASGPVNLTTPHLIGDPPPDPEKAEDDRRGHMPPGMWDRILDVEREGWRYLDGERAPKPQTDLFDGNATAGEDGDDTGAPPPADTWLDGTPKTRRRRPRDPAATP